MEVKFLIAGDSAISVQLGSEINLEVNGRVRKLFESLSNHPIGGIRELVPTYASLLVHYAPEIIRFQQLKEELAKRVEALDLEQTQKKESVQIVKEIPICYDKDLGLDIEDCAAYENISIEEFIRIHSSHEYYCYMLGVAPGHPYMSRFEEHFHFKRRETPRVHIKGGSVVAQLGQSNLIPFDQPCGWNIVGATPVTVCDYSREDPFLVHAGDWVRYVPVSRKEYEQIKKDDQKGVYRIKTYEKKVV